MRKFASKITNAQFSLARAFEKNQICSISAAVKAFEKQDCGQINTWKKELEKKRSISFLLPKAEEKKEEEQ